MSKVFYISDTHFDHANIIKLANRPFADVDLMNKVMVDNWNNVVGKDDFVHHLGDFAWKNPEMWLNQLNGRIIFYEGNHDKGMKEAIARRQLTTSFNDYRKYDEVEDHVPELGKIKIVLFHYPIVEWNGMFRGSYHFYGHVHTNPLREMPINWKARAWNVGAECLDYRPQTAEEIIMKGNR
jgi:calcineurin-like phosphoesterase family protein